MKKQTVRYKNAKEFGKSLGLSELEMELIRQKKKLIERLKIARTRKRLSQAKLATLVGSKQPAIARMESGLVSEVSLDFLAKVALALEISFTFKHAA